MATYRRGSTREFSAPAKFLKVAERGREKVVNKEVQHQEHHRLDVFRSVAGWLRSRDAQDVGAGWADTAMRVCFRRLRLVVLSTDAGRADRVVASRGKARVS